MRANQAAIQRRVNTPRVQTQTPPSYGASQSQQQQQPPSANNSYTPYQPQNTNYSQTPSQQSQNNIQTPPLNAAPSTGKMPPGLNPQQQLQFILNVLGERIAKLENNVSQLSSNPVSLNGQQQQPINPAALQSAIASHPEIAQLKEALFKIQSTTPSSKSSDTASPNVIDDIQANIETIFQYIESDTTPDVSKIQEELQTRTELLATEINQVKDMVLQLQSTVINVLLPAIVSNTLPPAPISTLENFTQAPLDIIPEDPAIAAAALEKNLEIAELPTLVESLSYQES
jgi:hypothetical protein